MAEPIKAVVFDIIETVFSLEPVRERMVEAGFEGLDLETWFAFGLRNAFALDTTEQAKPFPDILADALDELTALRGLRPDAGQRDAVLSAFSTMPAQDGAVEAFQTLTDAKLPIYALSNGPAKRTRSLLEGAGLEGQVAAVLSVEEVGRFKPQRTVYDLAIEAADVPVGQTVLVACHAWDVHGAQAAGMQGAFVERGQHYPKTMLPPDMTAPDLREIAELIVQRAG